MRSLPGDPAHPNYFVPMLHPISLERFHEIKDTWVLWRSLDRNFLPTEIRKQPDTLLNDILYIDSVFEAMVGQRMEQYRAQQEQEKS
jgi:hypothetical protein